MADPIVDVPDLAVYLNDPSIDADRAAAFITDAQTLCESVIEPLPVTAAIVVKRVAARAYVTAASSRTAQLQAAGSPYAGNAATWVYLTQYDIEDLRRLNNTGGAFSVDLLPAGYTPPASWTALTVGDWDTPPGVA